MLHLQKLQTQLDQFVIDSFVAQMKISQLEMEIRNNLTQPLSLQDAVEHGNGL